ncbi:MAG: DUF1127 domain-containing protein [Hyphomicrobiales bacterium]|nr:DUF1127 domain-containing protein [Hyphomicrobiales bacterium]
MPRSKSFPSALLAGLSGAIANGKAVFARGWTTYRHRRVVRDMLGFDEHMLRDIGLTPGDVAAALSMPLLDDPSTRLRILAVERRAAFRAQRRETLRALREGGATIVEGDNVDGQRSIA